jgi:ketosteroid isomerase-like protein
MRFLGRILSLALVTAFAACSQQQTPDVTDTDTSAADADAVRAHVDQFVSAWNTADDAALGPMVAEDAVLMQPDGPVLEGSDAILAVIAAGYDIALIQQSATVDEVIVIGDYAYGRGTWNLEPTPEAGADVLPGNGKWSVIYQRGLDGGWQIWRWMWNQPSVEVPAVE